LDLFPKDETAKEREEIEAANILNMPLNELKAMIAKKEEEGKKEFTVALIWIRTK